MTDLEIPTNLSSVVFPFRKLDCGKLHLFPPQDPQREILKSNSLVQEHPLHLNQGSWSLANQLQEQKLFQVAAGDATISVDRICCLRKASGRTLLVFPRSLISRISPQKYLLPYRDQLSSEDTLYRVLLSPKSQDRFSFWPFGIFHTRPESVSCRNPRRLPSAILLSESRGRCNANCN